MRKLHKSILVTLCLLISLFLGKKEGLTHSVPNSNENKSSYVSVFPDNLPVSMRKIVIDAGHGGKDHGCSVHHCQEKKINLEVALKLGRLLVARYPTLEVIYTRTNDRFVSLGRRSQLANERNADLFISIHCNYVKEKEVAGSETFILGSHKDAHHQHHGHYHEDYIEDTPFVIDNYLQAQSIDIAHAIEKAFANLEGHKSRGIKRAAFSVLRETTMPSVLVEMGFLSNADDHAKLNSKEGQDAMAQSLYQACLDYFETLRQRESISYQPEVVKYAYQDQHEQNTIPIQEEAVPSATYRVQFAEFKEMPIIDSSDKWKNLGSIEIKKGENAYQFYTQSFDSMDQALARKTFLEQKGFKGAYIVTDN